jgi:hypothetical protein
VALAVLITIILKLIWLNEYKKMLKEIFAGYLSRIDRDLISFVVYLDFKTLNEFVLLNF